MDTWLLARESTEREIAIAVEPFRDTHLGLEPRKPAPEWARQVTLTEAQWRFVWNKFQPVADMFLSFAKIPRLTAATIMRLTWEQRAWLLTLAYRYREKLFFNPHARQLSPQQFVAMMRWMANAGPRDLVG